MAVNQLMYTINTRGGIATVGNTLGLFGQTDTTKGADGIGCFITNDTTQKFGNYPAGTTSDWTKNSSSNRLTLPVGATILKAFLFYSGTAINGVQNVTAFTSGAVNFIQPSGATVSITPDNVATVVDTFGGNTSYHARKDVTSLMQGSGTYTLARVPGSLGNTVTITSIETNYLGWTIVVTYRDNSLNIARNLSTWDIFDEIYNNSPVDVTVSGFITPPLRSAKGTLFIAAGSGDNYLNDDRMQFGPNAAGLVSVSGPNNGLNNFFQSQVNDDLGKLSTTGTFGTSNQPYAGSGTAGGVFATRQGWDKTAVDVSNQLTTNQTSALIRFFTTGDLYFPQYAALQVELNAPIITPTKTVSSTTSFVGGYLTYTINFTNVGNANADNITVTDPIPSGTSYVVGSITSNVAITGTPATGITLLNPVVPGQSVSISYRVRVNTIPTPNPIPNTATLNYTFVPVNGLSPIAVVVDTNTVYTRVYADPSPRGITFI